ncbi:MAG: Male sterility protein [Myxococcaceae bacterium]|nr:Male sterility protein [Myxococcaceae bacterium]
MTEPLSIQKALAGRHILFTGASGFLGKVWLTMMLDKVPEVGRIYVLLRGKKSQNARARFEQMLNESFAFAALHEKHGEEFSRFITERVEVVAGDVSQPGLGVEAKLAERIQKNLDLVVHCAGQVDFNPELSEGVETNLEGTIHAAEFAAQAKDAGFVQVSTCFVAGNREGRITEQAIPNYAPNGKPFDVEAEYLVLKQLVAQVHEDCSSDQALAELRQEVAESIAKKGHDPENHALIDRILKREAKARLADRLVQVGKDRAAEWGWPNVYTFTKSMGESMLLARFPQLRKTFFRPAIIESAQAFPMPGWNEGLNTSGPLVYFTGTWFRHLPARKDKPLDVVPVDYCCAALIAVGAALLDGRAKPVYQCCTSDRHPLTVGRGLELTTLAHRKHYRNHGVDAIERIIMSRWDSRVVGDDHFMNVDNMRKVAQWIGDLTKEVPESLPKKWRAELKKLGSRSNLVDKKLGIVDKVLDTFKPFVSENRQIFACDELVGLHTVEEFFHYEPRKLDWRRYWIDQHVPGLRRWSFPIIEGTKVELYRPKYPVRLLDPAPLPEKARASNERLPTDKRRRTAQASGAAE